MSSEMYGERGYKQKKKRASAQSKRAKENMKKTRETDKTAIQHNNDMMNNELEA